MVAGEIVQYLLELSPIKYACAWDNSGRLFGRQDKEVKKVLFTLDVSSKAVEKAIETGADMIVSHHPFIFAGIKNISDENSKGKNIMSLISHDISVYSMHTNFDAVGGMSDVCAEKIGLEGTGILEETADGRGIGKIGTLKREMTGAELISLIKKEFNLSTVSYYGDINKKVFNVAMGPGAGGEFVSFCIEKQYDAYISGDIKYHDGIEAEDAGLLVIDAGHYGLEHVFIDFVGDYLAEKVPEIEIVKMEFYNPQKYI